MTTKKNDLWTVTTAVEEIVLKVLDVKDISLEPTQYPPNFPITWQRDPRWKDLRLGDLGRGVTIGNAGCALCCLMSWLQWKHGEGFHLMTVLSLLHEQRLLVGENHTLMAWDRVRELWPEATYNHSCYQNWRKRPVDLLVLDQWLQNGPVIVEVDFKSVTPRIDQHFVVAISWIENNLPLNKRRLWVMDPWEGTVVALPPAYYNEQWDRSASTKEFGKVARTITGARAIGHAGEVA